MRLAAVGASTSALASRIRVRVLFLAGRIRRLTGRLACYQFSRTPLVRAQRGRRRVVYSARCGGYSRTDFPVCFSCQCGVVRLNG